MKTPKKSIKEEFAKFFETPSRESLRDLLKNNLGEFPHCDFKKQWPSFPKIAKHLIGISNTGGGCIIIGVEEKNDNTLEIQGINALTDKSDCTNALKKFLPTKLLRKIEIIDFAYEDSEYNKLVGKKFQVILATSDVKHMPYISCSTGEGIKENVIYIRRGTSTEAANYDELQEILNKRIDTGYSTQSELNLEEHLEQLKILYAHIEQYNVRLRSGLAELAASAITQSISSIVGKQEKTPNPLFPKEGFEEFVAKIIDKKKRKIESDLDVKNT